MGGTSASALAGPAAARRGGAGAEAGTQCRHSTPTACVGGRPWRVSRTFRTWSVLLGRIAHGHSCASRGGRTESRAGVCGAAARAAGGRARRYQRGFGTRWIPARPSQRSSHRRLRIRQARTAPFAKDSRRSSTSCGTPLATDASTLPAWSARSGDRTGVRSLKVGYNRVFGYYIEVSNPNLAQVPDDYTRRQTLVGGERFITPELKEYESMLLNAQERMEDLESHPLQACVRSDRGVSTARLPRRASAVGRADVLAALSEAAARYGYVRPTLNLEGRHRDQGTGGIPWLSEPCPPAPSFQTTRA